jgi:hypothetical protein
MERQIKKIFSSRNPTSGVLNIEIRDLNTQRYNFCLIQTDKQPTIEK